MKIILLILIAGFLMTSCSGARTSNRYEPVQEIAKRELPMEAQLEKKEHPPSLELFKFNFS